MSRTAPRGYAGLIALLITVAIIGFLFWRSDLFTPKPATTPTGTTDLLQGSTQVQQDINAVNAAKNAKQLMESNYAQQQKAAGY